MKGRGTMGDMANYLTEQGMDDLAQGGWCEECQKWVAWSDLEYERCCEERKRREF
jgi:hypothetical protein